MKKLVLVAVAIVAVSFASCGNKQADAEKAKADSIRIADSIEAVEKAAADSIRISDSIAAIEKAAADAAAAAIDTVAVDSVTVVVAE